jgi:hypothetical protein
VGRRLYEQLSEALRAQECITCTVLGNPQYTRSCGMGWCGFLRGSSDPGAVWTESFVESKWPVAVSDETARAIRSSRVRRWRPQTLPKVKSSARSARSGSAFGLVNAATGEPYHTYRAPARSFGWNCLASRDTGTGIGL